MIEPGGADVTHRASGADIGYVLANNRGWEAFLCSNAGVPLVAAVLPVDERWQQIIGPTREVTTLPLRRDAVTLVWEAHLARIAADVKPARSEVEPAST